MSADVFRRQLDQHLSGLDRLAVDDVERRDDSPFPMLDDLVVTGHVDLAGRRRGRVEGRDRTPQY